MIDIKKEKEDLNLVFAGHVDHGKSTIIGRLLVDTHSLSDGKLEQVKETCRRNGKPFEYAFLLDALKDEQSQGITIDSARCFFKTSKRNYIIIDAPGHIEFLKNMITGASIADAGLLVIDAKQGVQENSRRHGYMLSMLGIKQIAVLVNKMDLVDYKERVFNDIVQEYSVFLSQINIDPETFIPVSGTIGDNVAQCSRNMSWYTGRTVLEELDQFEIQRTSQEKPFRMSVQDVYKFSKDGDNRRIIAGTIDTGVIKLGDSVVFYPSGKKSRVLTIEEFNKQPQSIKRAADHFGMTLEEQIYIKRGEIVTINGQPKPEVSTRIKANIFWLGNKPMVKDKEYFIKVGTQKVRTFLEAIHMVMDASTLNRVEKNRVDRNDIAEITLKTEKAIAFDLPGTISQTSRFVIVDEYEITGGGTITSSENDQQDWIRNKVLTRNYKWIKSAISKERRAEKYSQKPTLILITGEKSTKRKEIAKDLEQTLFEDGKFVYYLGIGNVLYGVDADIKEEGKDTNKKEHLRRMAEVAHIMLDSGTILIISAVKLWQSDVETIKTIVDEELIETVWVGSQISTDIKPELHLVEFSDVKEASRIIKSRLQDKGIIFRP